MDVEEMRSEPSAGGTIITIPLQPELPPIGKLLRSLRGERTLRQVEADTGISNSYLSNIENGTKRPGLKTLARLAGYHQIALQDLLQALGLGEFDAAEVAAAAAMEGVAEDSLANIQRSYDFVLADPEFARLTKPSGLPPIDLQKFVVEMYEHYTGKKLL